jgi:serine/threonine protein kinase
MDFYSHCSSSRAISTNIRQEIRDQGYHAAFSQKSDIYALGCILYRICTLQEPYLLDGIKPRDMSEDYSFDLLELVSSMLGTNRDERPTASQVKDHLAATALHSFQVATPHCPTCSETFPSKTQLSKHQEKTGHKRHTAGDKSPFEPVEQSAKENTGLRIRGAANAENATNAASEYYDDVKATNDATNSPSCIVCRNNFNKKKQFFGHIHGANHCRSARYIAKRRADVDADKEDQRLAKWIRKDMMRDD